MRGRKPTPAIRRANGDPASAASMPRNRLRQAAGCRPPVGRGEGGMAPAGDAAARDGRADRRRPRGAGGLLPGLARWVEAEETAEGDAGAAEDAVGLRPAVALALGRQQAAGTDGALHGGARPHAGGADAGSTWTSPEAADTDLAINRVVYR